MQSRRTFLGRAAAMSTLALSRPAVAAGPRYPWPAEAEDYRDPITGAYVRMLTPRIGHAEIIYQTHPMWTKGMDYFVFFSIQGEERIPMVRQVGSGVVRPLVDRGIGAAFLASDKETLYFIQDRAIYRQPIESTFQHYRAPEKIAEVAVWIERMMGGVSLDADGKMLYTAAALKEDEGLALVAFDMRANVWRARCTVDFEIGHVQAHPRISGLVMFCHETGGDAAQRMWRVMPGETEALPMYREQGEEWVTHEVWWNNRALFTIWPYNDERLKYRYGIVSVDLQGQDEQWHARYKAWHTAGSPDGKWILGDDFDRNVWLVAPSGQKRRLLTQGHNGEGFSTHPHASFTPDSRAVVLASSRFGREAILLVELPPWDELPDAVPDE